MTYDHETFIERLEDSRPHDLIERDVRDLGRDIAVTIDILPDSDADLSFLGKYDGRMEEWTIDRKAGRYYGVYASKVYEIALGAKRWDDEYELRDPNRVESALRKLAERDGWDFEDEYAEYTFDYDVDSSRASLDVSGYEILADELGHNWGRNEWRYFHPERADDEEDPKYAVEDYQLYEQINSGSAWVNGIEVTLYVKGEEIASDSIWGIIDGDDSHFRELANECLAEILYRLPDTLASRRRALIEQMARLDAVQIASVRSAAKIMLLQSRDNDYNWRADKNDYDAEAGRYR